MRRITAVPLFLCILISGGCSRLALRQNLNPGAGDIPMYGYSPARNNTAISEIAPPFDSVWEVDMGAGTGIYPPAVVDSVLFIGNLRGEILAVDIRTGEIEGKKKMGSAVTGTPAIDGTVVYVPLTSSKQNLIAYDFHASSEVWKINPGNVESSPLLSGSRLYFGTLEGNLFCVDAATGNIEWKYPVSLDSRKGLIRSSPASDGERMVFCCDDGTIFVLERNGTLSWKTRADGSVVASPAVSRGKVYVASADGFLCRFSIRTGSLEWKKNLDAPIYASPAVGNGRIVAACVDGTVWCLDELSGELLWKKKTEGVIAGSPVISGSMIYLGSLDHVLYTLLLESGRVTSQLTFRGRLRTSPLIYGDYLFLVVESRYLVALRGRRQ